MNDLELTKLCAMAMLETTQAAPDGLLVFRNTEIDGPHYIKYSPLTDDDQALKIVKKFKPDIWETQIDGKSLWAVGLGRISAVNADLNRAICEFVIEHVDSALPQLF